LASTTRKGTRSGTTWRAWWEHGVLGETAETEATTGINAPRGARNMELWDTYHRALTKSSKAEGLVRMRRLEEEETFLRYEYSYFIYCTVFAFWNHLEAMEVLLFSLICLFIVKTVQNSENSQLPNASK